MTSAIKRIMVGSCVIAGTLVAAVFGYWLAGWDLLDSVYMVIITIFGVGYGEVHPVDTPGMKLFTIGVIVVGTSAGFYIVGGFLQMITEGEIQKAIGVRRMTKQIDDLAGHTVICGFGRIGRMMADGLTENRKPFVVVDEDSDRVGAAQEAGFLALIGNATDEESLLEAGIRRADVLATVLPDDAANVFITLTARNLNRNLKILARGELPSTEVKLKQAGADHVVLPARIGAVRMINLITNPTAFDQVQEGGYHSVLIEELTLLGLEIDDYKIEEGSPIAGSTISEIDLSGSAGCVIVALKRSSGDVITDLGSTTPIEAGDRLVVIGHKDGMPKFERRNVARQQIQYRGAQG